MQLTLDPYMVRTVPLTELPGLIATSATSTSSCRHARTSSRSSSIRGPTPRCAGLQIVAQGREGEGGVVLPLFLWSGPDEDERRAAVRYWTWPIELTVELGCQVMNSELNGRPEAPSVSEAQFWRSLEKLLPLFEHEGIQLLLEPHPDDFIEDGIRAVDLIRRINSPNVSFLYCAPHTFLMGGDIGGIMEHAGDLLTYVHVADSFDHRATSGLRCIVNPPARPQGSTSISISGRAKSTGTCSSRPSAGSASTGS